MFSRRTLSAALLFAAAVTLTGCSSPATGTAVPASPSPAAASPSASAPALTISDPWVKTAEKGMSAAFGTLVNNSDNEVRVVSGASPLSSRIELHEVVEAEGKMVMRPKEGGFVIPAHGTHRLEPGGDHIMLMDITEEVRPGAQIPFTLTSDGGATLKFTATGKDFAGGKEDYQPGMDMGADKGTDESAG
ncbi:copper chaperone PCu(A)C [Streptosporangium sp. KLBMP 9127]|nr:copper chaperone PCu(A)C [Streptosporangium sp. KLBMP 9127]